MADESTMALLAPDKIMSKRLIGMLVFKYGVYSNMSLLEHLEKGEQRYEAIPAAMIEARLPLQFATRSGICTIVDHLQTASAAFYLFKAASRPAEIIDFVRKSLYAAQYGAEASSIVIILVDEQQTQANEVHWRVDHFENAVRALRDLFPNKAISYSSLPNLAAFEEVIRELSA